MFKKLYLLIRNFYAATRSESLATIVPSLILTFLAFLVIRSISCYSLANFTNEIVDTCITISSLLTAFSLASVTILATSSSVNIEAAKNTKTKKKNASGWPLNYYQLVLVKSFYSVFTNILLLSIAIISKYLSTIFNINMAIVLVCNLVLIHSILVLIMMVLSLYHLLFPDKKPDEEDVDENGENEDYEDEKDE